VERRRSQVQGLGDFCALLEAQLIPLARRKDIREDFGRAHDLRMAVVEWREPEAHEVGSAEVADYAARKGMSVSEAERWLAPNLDYEPETVPV